MNFYLLLTVLSTVVVLIAAAPFSEQTSEDRGQYGDYFEGDMRLTDEQYRAIERAKLKNQDNDTTNDDSEDVNAPKNGIRDPRYRWPNKTVTYEISARDFSKEQIMTFEGALQEIEDKSCITFRKKQSDSDYVLRVLKRSPGCFSDVGYLGKRDRGRNFQMINLSNNCFAHSLIVHEMLHTLGFFHMQSTYDRDDYVTIIFENIQRGYEDNFAKFSNRSVTEFGVPYDYGSVMHYEDTAFSKNGKKTIVPKKEGAKLGNRVGMTRKDVAKLRRMYDCPTDAPTTEKESIMENLVDTVSALVG